MTQHLDAEVPWKAITGMRKTQTERILWCI